MPWIACQVVDLQVNCSAHEVQRQKNSCHRKCCGSVVAMSVVTTTTKESSIEKRYIWCSYTVVSCILAWYGRLYAGMGKNSRHGVAAEPTTTSGSRHPFWSGSSTRDDKRSAVAAMSALYSINAILTCSIPSNPNVATALWSSAICRLSLRNVAYCDKTHETRDVRFSLKNGAMPQFFSNKIRRRPLHWGGAQTIVFLTSQR